MTFDNINELFNADNVDVTSNLGYIFNNSTLTIWYQNTSHEIIWGNNNFFDLIDSSLDAVKGDYCYRILNKQDHPCSNCTARQALKTGQYKENRVKFKDKTFRCRDYPIKNKKGHVIGLVEIFYDISENLHLERKLENENLKTTFFSNISHDFKIPLQLIYSAFKLLESNLKDKPRFKKYLDIIEQNYYRLVKLVNNIIDISKIKSGNYKLRFQNVDIVKLIKKTAISVSEHIKKENKTLVFNANPESRIIACSPFEIERVMLNLLSNALKFTMPGDKIIISVYEKNSDLFISIKDTGKGIPEHMQDKIFERFSRDSTTNVEGSGMGLSIVKALISMHNGEITYNSNYQDGSEFIISLPLKKLDDEVQTIENNMDYNLLERINIEFSDLGVLE